MINRFNPYSKKYFETVKDIFRRFNHGTTSERNQALYDAKGVSRDLVFKLQQRIK